MTRLKHSIYFDNMSLIYLEVPYFTKGVIENETGHLLKCVDFTENELVKMKIGFWKRKFAAVV